MATLTRTQLLDPTRYQSVNGWLTAVNNAWQSEDVLAVDAFVNDDDAFTDFLALVEARDLAGLLAFTDRAEEFGLPTDLLELTRTGLRHYGA